MGSGYLGQTDPEEAGRRRSLMASVEATRFAQSMLISDLAIQYYELIGLDRRKEVLRNALASARRSHELTRQLKKEGAETQLAVDQFYARVLSIESKCWKRSVDR